MSLLDAAWSALGEDPAALALVRSRGADVPLASHLPVGEFVHDAIAAASLAAAFLAGRRAGSAVPGVELDPRKVATAVTSERHFRLSGEPITAWAELSGFWRTADGWVRTHANYPHHRARLLEALGLGEAATPELLRAHLAGCTAEEVEDVVCARGGIATVVRTEAQWHEHPQSAAVGSRPLVQRSRRPCDGASTRAARGMSRRRLPGWRPSCSRRPAANGQPMHRGNRPSSSEASTRQPPPLPTTTADRMIGHIAR